MFVIAFFLGLFQTFDGTIKGMKLEYCECQMLSVKKKKKKLHNEEVLAAVHQCLGQKRYKEQDDQSVSGKLCSCAGGLQE